MARRRSRSEKIHALNLSLIERQIGLLEIETIRAAECITTFTPHYDAIMQLRDDLRRALNLLNDRPADYREPRHEPFSQAKAAG